MHFPDPNLPAAGRNPSRIPPSPERSVPVCGRLGWRLEREGEEGGRRRGEGGGDLSSRPRRRRRQFPVSLLLLHLHLLLRPPSLSPLPQPDCVCCVTVV
jgi:hypothetical protein